MVKGLRVGRGAKLRGKELQCMQRSVPGSHITQNDKICRSQNMGLDINKAGEDAVAVGVVRRDARSIEQNSRPPRWVAMCGRRTRQRCADVGSRPKSVIKLLKKAKKRNPRANRRAQ